MNTNRGTLNPDFLVNGVLSNSLSGTTFVPRKGKNYVPNRGRESGLWDITNELSGAGAVKGSGTQSAPCFRAARFWRPRIRHQRHYVRT
ncbi:MULTISPECIES: hypothetical protein [Paraburkholderia]|nr:MULTISPECIES: hypothetical protein [Paraburkholderia]MPW21749.1 hypothetical protein [Paraburkholderia franconis]